MEAVVEIAASMNTSEGLSVPVSSLYPHRYNLGRTKIYEFLKTLKITPFKVGKVAHITLEQLKLLDGFVEAWDMGDEAVRDFIAKNIEMASQPMIIVGQNEERMTFTESPMMELAQMIVAKLQPVQPDLLNVQVQLQRAADHDWWLDSSQLKELLGVTKIQDGMVAYGFQFRLICRFSRQNQFSVHKVLID